MLKKLEQEQKKSQKIVELKIKYIVKFPLKRFHSEFVSAFPYYLIILTRELQPPCYIKKINASIG